MHEKKILKSYGGISKKYRREMAVLTFGSMSLAMAIDQVMSEMNRDDSDHGEIQSDWLNGPYLILQQGEALVADFESKVNADPQFSDKAKQELMHDLIEPIKDGNRKAREIDAYIMNGTPLPSMEL